MTSRRIISNEKTLLDQDDLKVSGSEKPISSSIAPAVPVSVIVKLLGFTLAMIVGPIGTYFLTLHTIFKGNATWAGATAAITANIVLIAYVVVAFRDDESERLLTEAETKKGL